MAKSRAAGAALGPAAHRRRTCCPGHGTPRAARNRARLLPARPVPSPAPRPSCPGPDTSACPQPGARASPGRGASAGRADRAGVKAGHRDGGGLSRLARTQPLLWLPACVAPHQGTHSQARGSASSLGTVAALARLLPAVPSSRPETAVQRPPCRLAGRAPTAAPLHPACIQRGLEAGAWPQGPDSPAALRQPQSHQPLSRQAAAPGEELCFRLCFTEMHLLMFD